MHNTTKLRWVCWWHYLPCLLLSEVFTYSNILFRLIKVNVFDIIDVFVLDQPELQSSNHVAPVAVYRINFWKDGPLIDQCDNITCFANGLLLNKTNNFRMHYKLFFKLRPPPVGEDLELFACRHISKCLLRADGFRSIPSSCLPDIDFTALLPRCPIQRCPNSMLLEWPL